MGECDKNPDYMNIYCAKVTHGVDYRIKAPSAKLKNLSLCHKLNLGLRHWVAKIKGLENQNL